MPEIEAKFLLQRPEQYAETLDALATLGFTASDEKSETILDRYFDTPDWRIYRAGWTFRRRARGGDEQLTLKALAPCGPRSAVFVREEIDESSHASGAANGAEPTRGAVTGRLHTIVNGSAPEELFCVATARRRRVLERRGGEPLRLELALDQTEITDVHSHQLSFAELELELLQGSADDLEPLARTLASDVGLLPARLSKFERGLQTAGLEVPRPPERARPTLNDPVLLLPYFHLAEQRAALERELPRAWEGLDPEGVHSMRVAVRRSRAILATFKRLLPQTERAALADELKWLSGALGTARDADVERSRLERYLEHCPAAERNLLGDYAATIRERSRVARERLIGILAGGRFRALMNRLETWLEHEPSAPALRRWGDFRIKEGAGLAVNRAMRRVLKRGKKLASKASPEALHELRLAAKRLRYTLEFFGPYYSGGLKSATRSAKALQDALGDYQDAQLAKRHAKHHLGHHALGAARRAAVEHFISTSDADAKNAYSEFTLAWQKFRKSAASQRARPSELRR